MKKLKPLKIAKLGMINNMIDISKGGKTFGKNAVKDALKMLKKGGKL